MTGRAWTALLLTALGACGGAEASRLAVPRIDTLPGGAVQVSNDGPSGWTGSTAPRFRETLRFQGEDGTPSELGDPRSLAVDDAGRIYIADGKPPAIKVFNPDGSLLRVVGREGEGPGEFRTAFIAVRGASLVVHDPQVARTSVFDTAGRYLRSWHSSCCYWSDILIDRENRIVVPDATAPRPGQQARGTAYIRWSLEGQRLDTIWAPHRESGKYWTVTMKQGGKAVMSMMTSVPFTPELVHALHPEGGFVYGWTGEYRLVRSATGADSAKVFGRAWTAEPVSEQARQEELERRVKQMAGNGDEAAFRDAFKLEDIPSTLPAYRNIRVDPSGRVWVRQIAPSDTGRTRFDLFDSSGAWLGPVSLPVRLDEWGKLAWTPDGLVAVIEDAEGRPTVVRLAMSLSP